MLSEKSVKLTKIVDVRSVLFVSTLLRIPRKLTAIFASVVSLTLLSAKTPAQTTSAASGVKEGIVKLADSNIEYVSRGEGESVVFLPTGTLTVD